MEDDVNDRLRRLQVGCSGISRVWLDALRDAPDAEFVGFRDPMEHVLLRDMAVHTFGSARFLTGADPLTGFGTSWNPGGSWYAHGASAAVTSEMTGGVVFTYRGSWCTEGLPTAWESQ